MEKETYQQTADLFQILSHPARLQILDALRCAEACVCHLQAVLGRPQAYISQQLRVLREAGLVDDRRDGVLVYYHLVSQQVRDLLEETLGPVGEPTIVADCACPRCNDQSSCQCEDE